MALTHKIDQMLNDYLEIFEEEQEAVDLFRTFLKGECVLDASFREAQEESGLKSIPLVDKNIYDIDAHLIPENKGLAEHFLYDIRFLFVGDSDEKLSISNESKDL